MKTITIYDNAGHIYLQMAGSCRRPEGELQFLEVETPEGKQITGINTKVTPNIPIYGDIPKTDLQVANERIEALETYILDKEIDNTSTN